MRNKRRRRRRRRRRGGGIVKEGKGWRGRTERKSGEGQERMRRMRMHEELKRRGAV